VAKAGDLFRTTGSGVDDTTGEAPANKAEAGVEEYAKLASDSAALDTAAPDKKGAGVDEPIRAAGVEEPKDPSYSGAGVEDPMNDAASKD